MSKELAIILTAKNQASGPINKVRSDISTLDRVAGRAGQGVRTLGSNLRNMAIGAGVGVTLAGFAAIKSGLDSLAVRQNVIASTEAAIAATGGAAKVSAGQIRNWSEELERATGAAIDDKEIQASANTLLRVTSITEANFKRTLAAAIDLGAGLKTGPEAGAKLLAKAMADPVKGMTALRKAGIVLTDSEQARIKQLVKGNKVQAAQNALLAAVESRYKGAAAASAGPYQRALNLLADASEDAKMALAVGFLPVIEKVADRLSTALANPKTIADIRGLGKSIAGGFDAVLNASSQIPWDAIKSAMQMAGVGAKAAFDLFTGLPPWVQTAVLTGWGLNKLTGGAVGGIIGELGKGLIKGVLGLNAGVVNINAAVVNGPGGVPGGPGGGPKGGRGPGGIPLAPLALPLLVASLPLTVAGDSPSGESQFGVKGRIFDLERAVEGLRRRDPTSPQIAKLTAEIGQLRSGLTNPKPQRTDRAPQINPQFEVRRRDQARSAGEASVLQRATAAGFKPTADQITRTWNATVARQEAAAARQAMTTVMGFVRAQVTAADRIVAAIGGISIAPPIVNVTARSVTNNIDRWGRYNNRPPGRGPTIE